MHCPTTSSALTFLPVWFYKQACSLHWPSKSMDQILTVASSEAVTTDKPPDLESSKGLIFQIRAVCPYIAATYFSARHTRTVRSSETLPTNPASALDRKQQSKITPVWPSRRSTSAPVSACQMSRDLNTVPAATSPVTWISPEYKMQFSSWQKTRFCIEAVHAPESLEIVQCSTKLCAKSIVINSPSGAMKTAKIVSIADLVRWSYISSNEFPTSLKTLNVRSLRKSIRLSCSSSWAESRCTFWMAVTLRLEGKTYIVWLNCHPVSNS